MNPRTSANVMVLSPETSPRAHPYWYARVLGVFHARVLHTGPSATNRSVQHMEFLWVRWFGIDPEHCYGHKAARLPKIGFVPESDPLAFGFLDPSLVLRGCHLIPAFNDGRTSDLLMAPLTIARPPDEVDDWVSFYVNMYVKFFVLLYLLITSLLVSFVDRDMFMRHIGGGVGHSVINLKKGTGGEDSMDVDADHDHEAAAEGDEDIDYEDDLDEDDLDEENDDSEEEGNDPEDDDEDEFGPEDGEDVDCDYENDGFGDF